MDRFTALADPTRRAILEMLARRGEMPAGDIAAQFDVSAPAISQHLKALREAGLVLVAVSYTHLWHISYHPASHEPCDRRLLSRPLLLLSLIHILLTGASRNNSSFIERKT